MARHVLAAQALVLLAFAACGDRAIEVPAALQPLADEPLTAGVGTPSLQIGTTTIAECVQRYGTRGFAVYGGEVYGAELRYLRGQLVLTFDLPLLGHDDWPDLKSAHRDPESFVLARPAVSTATLTSITVKAGPHLAGTFYRGRIQDGFALLGEMFETWDALGQQPKMVDGGLGAEIRVPGMHVRLRRNKGDEAPDEPKPPHVVQVTVFAAQPASPR
jgi:hypothetical protein